MALPFLEEISKDKEHAEAMANCIYNDARMYLIGFVYAFEPIPFSELKNYFNDPPKYLKYHLDILEEADIISNTEQGYKSTEYSTELLDSLGVKERLNEIKVSRMMIDLNILTT